MVQKWANKQNNIILLNFYILDYSDGSLLASLCGPGNLIVSLFYTFNFVYFIFFEKE